MRLGRSAASLKSGKAAIFRVVSLLAFVFSQFAFCPALQAQTPTNPSYTAQGIVNAATQMSGALAPNALATIYGTNLSYNTASAAGYPDGSTLPTSLGA